MALKGWKKNTPICTLINSYFLLNIFIRYGFYEKYLHKFTYHSEYNLFEKKIKQEISYAVSHAPNSNYISITIMTIKVTINIKEITCWQNGQMDKWTDSPDIIPYS